MSGWYRADVGRHTHRKVRRLARELGVHTMHAVGIHDSLCAMVAEADAATHRVVADLFPARSEWYTNEPEIWRAFGLEAP